MAPARRHPRTTIADIGCGPGVLAHRFAELGADVLAVDLRADALAHVPEHPGLRTLQHDIEAGPLPTDAARLDAAVLSDVLHHFTHPERAVRHLSANVRTVLVAEYGPMRPELPDDGPPQEARLPPARVAALLRAAGFEPRPAVWPAPWHYAIVGKASDTWSPMRPTIITLARVAELGAMHVDQG